MKVLVSDMGGVLYSFDSGFDPFKHEERFNLVISTLGKSGPPVEEQLEGEWEAVVTGLLKIYPNENGVKNLQTNLKNFDLVIVSTSLTKTSQLILEKLGIVGDNIKIFDMSDFGNKREKEAWKKIFKQLPSVDVIVEDGERNLQAALLASRELGYSPRFYKEMAIVKD